MKTSFVFALSCVILAGCGSDDPQPDRAVKAEGSQPRVAVERITASDQDEVSRGTSPFLLDFQPVDLQSGKAVSVRVSGCSGAVDFAWSVNGAPIESVTGSRLAPEYFKRDDEIAVDVSCAGMLERISSRALNGPPTVIQVDFEDPEIMAGKDIVVIPESVDPDNDFVQYDYHWFVDGEEVSAENNRLPGNLVKAGQQIDLTVIPVDLFDNGQPYRGKGFTVPNSPPRFVTTPPQSFQVKQYSYSAQAVDPDNDEITYRLEEGPPGMVIDSNTGLVSWDIVSAAVGEYRVKIVAEDPSGLYSAQEFSFNLQLPE